MTLAAILGICLLVASWTQSTTYVHGSEAIGQATPSSILTQTAPAGQQQNQASPSKPAPAKPRRHRKTTSNCVDSATAGKPSAGQTSATAGSTALKPCPPKKTVVRNGGTDESSVQLTGSDPAKQVSQGTTAQLLAATEENLKKLSGRELKGDQQQTLNQIREFVEQSKQAAAAGDLERGQNLASKARLLSDELVKH